MANKNRKPLSDKLIHAVQVLLKEHEYKIFERLRRELNYPTNAAFARMILLKEIEKKRQTELI